MSCDDLPIRTSKVPDPTVQSHKVRTRKVRTDGIHFHNFRYLSLTLAAYVGEEA